MMCRQCGLCSQLGSGPAGAQMASGGTQVAHSFSSWPWRRPLLHPPGPAPYGLTHRVSLLPEARLTVSLRLEHVMDLPAGRSGTTQQGEFQALPPAFLPQCDLAPFPPLPQLPCPLPALRCTGPKPPSSHHQTRLQLGRLCHGSPGPQLFPGPLYHS